MILLDNLMENVKTRIKSQHEQIKLSHSKVFIVFSLKMCETSHDNKDSDSFCFHCSSADGGQTRQEGEAGGGGGSGGAHVPPVPTLPPVSPVSPIPAAGSGDGDGELRGAAQVQEDKNL